MGQGGKVRRDQAGVTRARWATSMEARPSLSKFNENRIFLEIRNLDWTFAANHNLEVVRPAAAVGPDDAAQEQGHPLNPASRKIERERRCRRFIRSPRRSAQPDLCL